MISISDKKLCCGCSACVQSCPKQCISFDEDEQGFRYPSVDASKCIDCRLCETVCPCINQNESHEPINVYAAINLNEEIRMKSSSGGIFTMLAEKVIVEGGIVFGAKFDENWEVKHDYTDTKEGIEAFRRSKYLQSRIGETYKKAQQFLKEGRMVLYSGTGCQIAGLKKFLKKEYDNLLAVEILCNSVPSPLVWRKYLKEKCGDNQIYSINFRDKISGWSNYSYSIVVNYDGGNYVEPASGLYMKGLTSNLTVRPSCFQCPARFGKSGADIVLGDCWGIWDVKPEMDDNKGVSILEVLSEKGNVFINTLKFKRMEISVDKISKYNSGLRNPAQKYYLQISFFQEIQHQNSISSVLKGCQTRICHTTKWTPVAIFNIIRNIFKR